MPDDILMILIGIMIIIVFSIYSMHISPYHISSLFYSSAWLRKNLDYFTTNSRNPNQVQNIFLQLYQSNFHLLRKGYKSFELLINNIHSDEKIIGAFCGVNHSNADIIAVTTKRILYISGNNNLCKSINPSNLKRIKFSKRIPMIKSSGIRIKSSNGSRYLKFVSQGEYEWLIHIIKQRKINVNNNGNSQINSYDLINNNNYSF